MKKHEMIFCIVNEGFADSAMDAAREVGARGGTVLHAKGTANAEAEKMFGIAIQPEKEIVMILVESDIKEAVLHALYQKAGLKTAGQGIAFSLPVSEAIGLSPVDEKAKKNETVATEAAAEVKAETVKKDDQENPPKTDK